MERVNSYIHKSPKRVERPPRIDPIDKDLESEGNLDFSQIHKSINPNKLSLAFEEKNANRSISKKISSKINHLEIQIPQEKTSLSSSVFLKSARRDSDMQSKVPYRRKFRLKNGRGGVYNDKNFSILRQTYGFTRPLKQYKPLLFGRLPSKSKNNSVKRGKRKSRNSSRISSKGRSVNPENFVHPKYKKKANKFEMGIREAYKTQDNFFQKIEESDRSFASRGSRNGNFYSVKGMGKKLRFKSESRGADFGARFKARNRGGSFKGNFFIEKKKKKQKFIGLARSRNNHRFKMPDLKG